MSLHSLASHAVDALYPRLCRSCGARLAANTGFFCAGCMAGTERLNESCCVTCSEPFPDGSGGARRCSSCILKPPPFEYARAPYLYRGAVKDAVHLYKYGGLRALEGFLSGTFEGMLREWFEEVTVVSAVPLHPKRLKERGFNQSLLLARSAAEKLGASFSLDGLKRTRYTRPQTDLSPGEREKNVRGAFSVPRPAVIEAQDVLLVDDVYTTGATVRECARVLKRAGAKKVYVLTVARAGKGI